MTKNEDVPGGTTPGEAGQDPLGRTQYTKEMRGVLRSLLVTLFFTALLAAIQEAAQLWAAQHIGQTGSAVLAAHSAPGLLVSAVPIAVLIIPIALLLLLVLAAVQAGTGAHRLAGIVAEQAKSQQERTDALLLRQSFLLAALAGTEDAVIAADTSERIVLLNPAAEKLTGWQEADAIGRQVQAVLTLVDERTGTALPALSAPAFAAKGQPDFQRHEFPPGTVQIARGGERFPVTGDAISIQEESGARGGTALTFRDISERQKQAAQLREMTAQRAVYEREVMAQRAVYEDRAAALQRDLGERWGALQDAETALRQAKADTRALTQAQSQEKSILLGDMSDELRTPLSAILGYSEMLQEEAEDEGLTSLTPDLQKIHKAGEHLLSLINDIRDLSRIEAGQMELYQETFSVAAMLNEVSVTARPNLLKSGNTLQVQVGEGVGEMDADRVKIKQTLLNLLSAAAGFLPGGTVLLQAGRERDGRGDWITFRLADSSAELARLPAQPKTSLESVSSSPSAESSEPSRFGGHGLALVMARRFCQMQGGELTGSREPGAGAVFQLRFPL